MSRPELPRGLYALCDDTLRPELPLAEKARLLVRGGVRVMQLRMKRTAGRAAVEAAKEVVRIAREGGCLCLINDRVDWALLSGADGVHLGDDDLPPADARKLLGPDLLIGATSRSLEEVERAVAGGADHVGYGPIFETSTKQVPAAPRGVEELRGLVRRTDAPVVAISGIGLRNIAAVAGTGCRCAAVGSALMLAEDIAAQAALLIRAFEEGRPRDGR